jgi:organic hydroperoxide reductase OsmC/OhrA
VILSPLGWSFYLFASACLLGAIQLMARQMGKRDAAKDAVVHAKVYLGNTKEIEGLGIGVDIEVEGVEEDVLKAGHEVSCFDLHAFLAVTDVLLVGLGVSL